MFAMGQLVVSVYHARKVGSDELIGLTHLQPIELPLSGSTTTITTTTGGDMLSESPMSSVTPSTPNTPSYGHIASVLPPSAGISPRATEAASNSQPPSNSSNIEGTQWYQSLLDGADLWYSLCPKYPFMFPLILCCVCFCLVNLV